MPGQSTKRRPTWLIPIGILIVAFALIFLLWASKPEPPTQESEEKEWLVNTDRANIGAYSPSLELLGKVESPFAASLSAAVTADVVSVTVREGQAVAKGQLLLALDDKEIALQVQRAEADVADLKSQIQSEINRHQSDLKALEKEKELLAITEKSVQRQARLNESNLVAPERYENAQSLNAQQRLSLIARELSIADHPNRLAQLKSRLVRAETSLADTRLDLQRTLVTAPFDGRVTRVHVAPGDRVNTGQTLVSLFDQSNIEVRAQVPDRQIALIAQALDAGIEIQASIQSHGGMLPAQLIRLSGQTNAGAGGVDAFFTLAENAEREGNPLILNSALKVIVQLPALPGTYSVPLSAIYGTDRMYLVEDGRLQSISVSQQGTRFMDDGQDHIIITTKGMKPGDTYITTQLPNAINGLKVKAR